MLIYDALLPCANSMSISVSRGERPHESLKEWILSNSEGVVSVRLIAKSSVWLLMNSSNNNILTIANIHTAVKEMMEITAESIEVDPNRFAPVIWPIIFDSQKIPIARLKYERRFSGLRNVILAR